MRAHEALGHLRLLAAKVGVPPDVRVVDVWEAALLVGHVGRVVMVEPFVAQLREAVGSSPWVVLGRVPSLTRVRTPAVGVAFLCITVVPEALAGAPITATRGRF